MSGDFPRAIVVMGVSGAGKTTLAQALADRLGYRFIEGDALHSQANIAKMAAAIPLDDDNRAPWLDRVGRALAEASECGGGVAACSALKRSYRDILRAVVVKPLMFVHPVLDRDELTHRIAGRSDHFMPASLISSQLDALEPASDDESVLEVGAQLPTQDQVAFCLRSWPPQHP